MILAAKELKRSFSSKNICDWSNAFSSSVWYTINFCRRVRGNAFKIYETTITQNMLFGFINIAYLNKNIVIMESSNERVNGNDIELFININKDKYISYPTQAKIIYKNGKYNKINYSYKRPPIYQIDRLLDYAKRQKGFALYFLYSESPTYRPKNISRNGIEYRYFGVSIVNASFIKKKYFSSTIIQVPTFNELIPHHVITLNEFLCNTKVRNAYSGILHYMAAARLMGYPVTLLLESGIDIDSIEDRYRLHSKEEVINQSGWINILQKEEEYQYEDRVDMESEEFNPRYRVLIDQEK